MIFDTFVQHIGKLVEIIIYIEYPYTFFIELVNTWAVYIIYTHVLGVSKVIIEKIRVFFIVRVYYKIEWKMHQKLESQK